MIKETVWAVCLKCKQIVYDCPFCYSAPCEHFGFARTLNHPVFCGPVLYCKEAEEYVRKLKSA